MTKFKVGDKVVPVSKSMGCPLSIYKYELKLVNENSKYLVIDFIDQDSGILCRVRDGGIHDGWWFTQSDLIPYEESDESEKPPVYYTLPASSALPNSEPDYKGFYEAIMNSSYNNVCYNAGLNCFGCIAFSSDGCIFDMGIRKMRIDLENKYIKRNS